ncbi:uncharacterized [Tachysurus ichikawai]
MQDGTPSCALEPSRFSLPELALETICETPKCCKSGLGCVQKLE